MQLKVGEYYLSVSSEIVQITSCDLFWDIFMDTSDNEYNINGKCIGDMREFDLIAHIPKQLLNHLIVEINNYHTDSDFRKVVDNVYGK